MSVVWKWNGDGLTSGLTVTTATVGTGDNPFTFVSAGITTTTGGPRPARLAFPDTAGAYQLRKNALALTAWGVRRYFLMSGLPSSGAGIIQGYTSAGTEMFRVEINTTGLIRLRNATTATYSQASGGLAVNQLYRVEVYGTAGTATVSVFADESTTALVTGTGAVENATLDEVRFGRHSSTTTITGERADDLAIGNTAALIGSVAVVTPTVTGVIRKWSGAGLAAGATVTTTTAGTGDNAFTFVSAGMTVSTAGLRTEIVWPETAGAYQVRWNVLGSLTTWAIRRRFRFGTAAAASWHLVQGMDAGGLELWRVELNTSGLLRLRDATGATWSATTGAAAVGTDYRLEVTSSGGSATVYLYQGDSTTVLVTGSGAVGSGTEEVRFGHISSTTVVSGERGGDFAMSNTAALIGPAVAAGAKYTVFRKNAAGTWVAQDDLLTWTLPAAAAPHIATSQVSLLLELDHLPAGMNTGYLSSCGQDDLTGDWFEGQEAPNGDGLVHRFTKTGVYVSTMTCTGADHMSSIAVQRTATNLFIWFDWPDKDSTGTIIARDLVRIQYNGVTKTKTAAQIINTGRSSYTLAALDTDNDLICLRVLTGGNELYEVHKLSQLLAGNLTALAPAVNVGPQNTPTFQGMAIQGNSVYRLTSTTHLTREGNSLSDWANGTDAPNYCYEYDWTTGALLTQKDFRTAGQLPGDVIRSSEPEGMDVVLVNGYPVVTGHWKVGSDTVGAADYPRSIRIMALTPLAATAPVAARTVALVGKSKLPWNSLVFGHGAGTGLAAFETWRNRPVDGPMYWPARQTWADMGQVPTRRAGDMMVYCIPPFPEGIGGSNANVANGVYDANIQTWAQTLINAGWNTADVVIRLGWENNLTSYQWSWSSTTYQAFINAYRKFVDVARAKGLTNVRWNWNLNKGPATANSSVQWTVAYPGDSWVDVIGIDPYDWYTPSTTDAQWTSNISGKNPGLQDVATFARSRGKQMSVDEWSTATVAASGGGDNPFYIQKMLAFVKANTDIMAWESYFNNNAQISSSTTAFPNAALEYKKAYPNGWG